MKFEIDEVLWLDEHEELSLAQLAELSRLTEAEVLELVEYGVLEPAVRGATRQTFRAYCVVAARTALRLRDDFELDAQGIALALTLLDRIRDLEAEVRDLHAQLPGRVR